MEGASNLNNEIITKKCSDCKESKTVDNFNKDKSRGDGYSYKCKTCSKNRNKIKYKENKEIIDQRNKNYRKNNPDKIADYHKQYNQSNKSKIREQKKKYCKNRRQNDETFRISGNLRCRILDALNGKAKSAKSLELVGLPSFELLHKWLIFNKSSNVTDEKPVVDHLIPCASKI